MKLQSLVLLVSLSPLSALGEGQHGHTPHAGGHDSILLLDQANMSDEEAIEALLKAQFHTKENPLSVAPIVVTGDHAVAGWAQDSRGGRAFLQKSDQGWEVVMCSGEKLVKAHSFMTMGMSSAEANSLQSAITDAEAKLSPNTIALFNSFEGEIILNNKTQGAHHH